MRSWKRTSLSLLLLSSLLSVLLDDDWRFGDLALLTAVLLWVRLLVERRQQRQRRFIPTPFILFCSTCFHIYYADPSTSCIWFAILDPSSMNVFEIFGCRFGCCLRIAVFLWMIVESALFLSLFLSLSLSLSISLSLKFCNSGLQHSSLLFATYCF